MYDKISLFADRVLTGDCSEIAKYIDEANDVTDRNTGEYRIFGKLQGLNISIYLNGIYITGSLTKFMHRGSNLYAMSRGQTRDAIDKISDLLHFKVDDSLVTSVEVGENFVMKHKPQSYLCRLGDMPYLHRFQLEASSLYYTGIGKIKPKKFVLYDKIQDAKNKSMEFPVGFETANVLRYEMRMKGRLKNQLQVPEVKAKTLYDPTFFRLIVNKWKDCYFSISKNSLNNIDMNRIKTPRDAFNAYVAMIISQSEENSVSRFIDELKQRGIFKYSSDYNRLRKMISDVSLGRGSITMDELVKELDDAIINASCYV